MRGFTSRTKNDLIFIKAYQHKLIMINTFKLFTGSLILIFSLSCGQKKNENQKTDTGKDTSSSNNQTQVDNTPQDKVYQGTSMDKTKYPEDLYVVMPEEITSSGYLKGKNEDYRADFMVDHDPYTWWTPNPNRNGEGAWIELRFPEEIPIEGFEVWGGSHNPEYPEFGDIYPLNNRVKKGVCEFSDGSTLNFELKDVDNWQVVIFDEPIKTKSIRLRINEVYKGDKWDDLCIAEFLALSPDATYAWDEGGMAKPVIYLYPEKKMDVNVQLDIQNMNGKVDVTYPSYGKYGWDMTAWPDGKLMDKHTGKSYNYLFWEGTTMKQWRFEDGFVVKGSESAAFLEDKLSTMGLLSNEYNDFIVYWLPLMQKNKYNLVRFANEEYKRDVPLIIHPRPQSVLRVYMVFKAIEEPISIPLQKLKGFERKGFTVVEWGGTEIKSQQDPDL